MAATLETIKDLEERARDREITDFIITILALGLAFTILFLQPTLVSYLAAVILVSISFLPHELMHRSMARWMSCYAHYRVWPFGLLLAIVSSFFGFVFAAPGAVNLSSKYHDRYGRYSVDLSPQQQGLIAISGPLINLTLAAVFITMLQVPTLQISLDGVNLILLAAKINVYLAFFNLLPFGNLDGRKSLSWSVFTWSFLFLLSLIFLAITFFGL